MMYDTMDDIAADRMRALWLLGLVAVACCVPAGGAFEPAGRMTAEVRVAGDGVARIAETSLRELRQTAGGRTSHGVQIVVRDAATGLFWTDLLRNPKPLHAPSMWTGHYAEFRFAANDRQLAAFHLRTVFLDASLSERHAPSLAAAEEQIADEMHRELESTWPITSTAPRDPVHMSLESALGRAFVFDSDLGPTVRRMTIESIASDHGLWIVTIRNDRGDTGRIVFSETLQPQKDR
jgi:hypothetical protein